MNATLLKGLAALAPAGALLSGSVVLFLRQKTMSSFLQVAGSGCLLVVVVAHICEALDMFPWMHWGLEHSAGHWQCCSWSPSVSCRLFAPCSHTARLITEAC
jgi:hypothetical protein